MSRSFAVHLWRARGMQRSSDSFKRALAAWRPPSSGCRHRSTTPRPSTRSSRISRSESLALSLHIASISRSRGDVAGSCRAGKGVEGTVLEPLRADGGPASMRRCARARARGRTARRDEAREHAQLLAGWTRKESGACARRRREREQRRARAPCERARRGQLRARPVARGSTDVVRRRR